MHASVGRALRDAWGSHDEELARKQLMRLATSLQRKYPGAAASLHEGLEETLTVQTLGITGALYRTLRTSNPIENLNGSIAHYAQLEDLERPRDGVTLGRQRVECDSKSFRKLRGFAEMKSLMKSLAKRADDDHNEASRRVA